MAGETNLRTAPSRREELVKRIALEEVRLARLQAEQSDARSRLAALKAELVSPGAEPEIRVPLPVVSGAQVPKTPADKVGLFRSLFRGRTDVFPTRFVSKRTGTPGYAPACRNKFVKGVCKIRAEFKAGDGGETAVYMTRWVNTRGEKGPWSEIATATGAA